jgi:peptidoglycan hydrolase FlgJ
MQINPTQLNAIKPLRSSSQTEQQQLEAARQVQQAFRDFVGQTFFGQMLKSMRSTVEKPAYFHGGQAEEIFQSQLDQTLAEEMTEASADQIADPMFRLQFPKQAQLLAREVAEPNKKAQLTDLESLRRR